MAFNTLIDKTQLENGLKATADAIRTKTGKTDKISWIANSGFANAVADISIPTKMVHTIPITLTTALGNGANTEKKVLTGNDFVKAHYADEDFFAMWFPVNATTVVASGIAGMVYHGNRAMITTKATHYGFFLSSQGETSYAALQANTAKLNGTGYNVSLRANSSGNISLYVASKFTIPAGDYLLVLGIMQ